MKYQDSYTKHFVKYLIKIIVAVCATKCFLLIFIFDIFKIPSNSMNPTLLAGDEIIVNKCLFGARIYKTYNFQNKFYQLNCFRTFGIRGIKYNDICVFNKSKQNNKIKFIINNVMCKRCLALPGDIISIQNGIYKNNHYKGQLGFIKQQIELSHKTYTSMPSNVIRSFPKENHFYWTIKKMGPLYIPRKGDRIYLTRKNATIYKMLIEYETDKYLSINWKANKVKLNNKEIKEYTFENNYYFMGGDNVGDSNDSRYQGPVPENFIIGIATNIIYSKNKNNIRWKRFGKNI